MRQIGLPVKLPQKSCEDPKCPLHGGLSVRGRLMEGDVVSDKMKGTVIVMRRYHHYVPKFERYERRHSHIPAHNPPCIGAKEGDRVRMMECRPLSKSVSFVIVEKMEQK